MDKNDKYLKEIGEYVLTTYKIQSDENIRKYLYPAPAFAKEMAKFLEENKLNVFSKHVTNISELKLIESDTLFWIDSINGKIISQQTSPIVIDSKKEEAITIYGWAVDKEANSSAYAVFLTIDGKIDIPTYYGLDRPDVAEAYKNPSFRF
ncbi:MAG: hypothetical protein QW589_04290 [Candidatus Bathyarchaeia archaeon]